MEELRSSLLAVGRISSLAAQLLLVHFFKQISHPAFQLLLGNSVARHLDDLYLARMHGFNLHQVGRNTILYADLLLRYRLLQVELISFSQRPSI